MHEKVSVRWRDQSIKLTLEVPLYWQRVLILRHFYDGLHCPVVVSLGWPYHAAIQPPLLPAPSRWSIFAAATCASIFNVVTVSRSKRSVPSTSSTGRRIAVSIHRTEMRQINAGL